MNVRLREIMLLNNCVEVENFWLGLVSVDKMSLMYAIEIWRTAEFSKKYHSGCEGVVEIRPNGQNHAHHVINPKDNFRNFVVKSEAYLNYDTESVNFRKLNKQCRRQRLLHSKVMRDCCDNKGHITNEWVLLINLKCDKIIFVYFCRAEDVDRENLLHELQCNRDRDSCLANNNIFQMEASFDALLVTFNDMGYRLTFRNLLSGKSKLLIRNAKLKLPKQIVTVVLVILIVSDNDKGCNHLLNQTWMGKCHSNFKNISSHFLRANYTPYEFANKLNIDVRMLRILNIETTKSIRVRKEIGSGYILLSTAIKKHPNKKHDRLDRSQEIYKSSDALFGHLTRIVLPSVLILDKGLLPKNTSKNNECLIFLDGRHLVVVKFLRVSMIYGKKSGEGFTEFTRLCLMEPSNISLELEGRMTLTLFKNGTLNQYEYFSSAFSSEKGLPLTSNIAYYSNSHAYYERVFFVLEKSYSVFIINTSSINTLEQYDLVYYQGKWDEMSSCNHIDYKKCTINYAHKTYSLHVFQMSEGHTSAMALLRQISGCKDTIQRQIPIGTIAKEKHQYAATFMFVTPGGESLNGGMRLKQTSKEGNRGRRRGIISTLIELRRPLRSWEIDVDTMKQSKAINENVRKIFYAVSNVRDNDLEQKGHMKWIPHGIFDNNSEYSRSKRLRKVKHIDYAYCSTIRRLILKPFSCLQMLMYFTYKKQVLICCDNTFVKGEELLCSYAHP